MKNLENKKPKNRLNSDVIIKVIIGIKLYISPTCPITKFKHPIPIKNIQYLPTFTGLLKLYFEFRIYESVDATIKAIKFELLWEK
nr:hypothetical protein [Acinetobacter sp. HY1485]